MHKAQNIEHKFLWQDKFLRGIYGSANAHPSHTRLAIPCSLRSHRIAKGIYVIISLSLRSNRQSLSRRQGTILIKTANAVTTTFSDIRTMDKKWDFLENQGIWKVISE